MTDLVDRATEENDAWLNQQIRQHLSTLPANTVTDCMDCGEPIGVQRKAALPHAVRCIDCQSLLERKA